VIIHTTWKVKGLAFTKMDKSEEENVGGRGGGGKQVAIDMDHRIPNR